MAMSTHLSRLFLLMRVPLTAALQFAEEHGHYRVKELSGNASLFGEGGMIYLLYITTYT